MFYRFENGIFIEAKTFDEAKQELIRQIETESEDPKGWHKCTCLGLSHRHNCPEMEGVIPY